MMILAFGSRHWTDRAAIRAVLAEYEYRNGPVTVIHGGNGYTQEGKALWGQADELAVRGADMLAGAEARLLGFEVQAYHPPEWVAGNFSPSAGPRRNSAMLRVLLAHEGERVALCFHENLAGSKGSVDMGSKLWRAGVTLRVFDQDGEWPTEKANPPSRVRSPGL